MKKTLTLTLAIALIALALFGCAPAAKTPEQGVDSPKPTEQPAATPDPGEMSDPPEDLPDDDASDPPEDMDYVNGPVLVWTMNEDYVDTLSNEVNPDGTYREELLFDAVVYISAERRLPTEYGAEAATLASLAGLAEEDLTIVPYELPSLGSYPAFRAEYVMGENEDTQHCIDILIHTDSWDYLFHTATQIDWMEDYSDIVEDWISTLELFDSEA